MQYTLTALRSRFELDYLEQLQKTDNFHVLYPERTKETYFGRRRNGEYGMVMVEHGWHCYQQGFTAAGGTVHGEG